MKLSPKSIACVRWFLLLTASAVTLLAIFIVEENWRGDRDWVAYERKMKASGESLELAAFASAPVPDHLNFFREPLLSRLFYSNDFTDRQKLLDDLELDRHFPLPSEHLQRNRSEMRVFQKLRNLPPDFAELREFLKQQGLFAGPESDQAALDVLTALQRLDPLLDALREAALRRPASSRYTGTSFIEVPPSGFVWKAGWALALRAHAALAMGDVPAAYLDAFTLLRFAESLTASPHPEKFMNSAYTLKTFGAGVIKDGCERRIWNDGQLAEFQRLLVSHDPLGRYANALRFDRAAKLYLLNAKPRLAPYGSPVPFWLFRGWVQQNKISFSTFYATKIIPALTDDPDRTFSGRLDKLQQVTEKMKNSWSPYRYLTRRSLINFAWDAEGYAKTSTHLLQVATLCGLERYRLARGSWPEKLEALVPMYLEALPMDIFSDQPFRYAVLPEGGIRLIAVGLEDRSSGRRRGIAFELHAVK